MFRTDSFSDELFTELTRRLRQSTKMVVDVCERPYTFKGVDPRDRVNVDRLHGMVKETRLDEGEAYKIMYTGQDVYSPGLEYVFGKAYAGDGICIISSRWLLDMRDVDRTVERLVRVTIHEIGHLLSLPHCEDPGCVMYRSNDVVGVDSRSMSFCEKCAESIGVL